MGGNAFATGMNEPGPKLSNDDFVRADDALIGRAFRWSVLVLAFLGISGGAVWYSKTRPEKRSVQITPLVPPALPERLAAEIPRVVFTAIPTNGGVAFVHQHGAGGDEVAADARGRGV